MQAMSIVTGPAAATSTIAVAGPSHHQTGARASSKTPARRSRRHFIGSCAAIAAAAVGAPVRASVAAGIDIIDSHTHFYDPSRPEGVPWPGRSDAQLYRPVYPRDYKSVSAPYGITGTVVIEASAWLEDNAWILELARNEGVIAGFVGRLTPGDPSFGTGLARFARNPLFRGIRVSGRDVGGLADPARLRDLAALAAHDLALDVNGDTSSLTVVAAVARAVPGLRIVIDHVANVTIDGKVPPDAWLTGMQAASAQRNVFCKVSGLVEGTGRRDGKAPADLEFYRPVLDAVWARFGEERLIYGSNWPVSELFAPFGTVHRLVEGYFKARGDSATRRYFADNARAAYKWVNR
jgi:L-fuconolactonase